MKRLDLELIRETRLKKNLSLIDMAEKLGMSSNSQYYKYEKGIYKFDANMIPALAKALDVKMEDLYN